MTIDNTILRMVTVLAGLVFALSCLCQIVAVPAELYPGIRSESSAISSSSSSSTAHPAGDSDSYGGKGADGVGSLPASSPRRESAEGTEGAGSLLSAEGGADDHPASASKGPHRLERKKEEEEEQRRKRRMSLEFFDQILHTNADLVSKPS